MNIHEYQAKELLRKFDISTPNGQIVESPEEAFFLTKS
ncbi:MAG: ATP-grasp domain-containing protein, partial [Holophagaceae bacterium]